jgi:hypothetical protein
MFVFDINNVQIVRVNETTAQATTDRVEGYLIQTAADLEHLTGFQLVQLFNLLASDQEVKDALQLAGQSVPDAVKKFSSKENGVTRTAKLIEHVSETHDDSEFDQPDAVESAGAGELMTEASPVDGSTMSAPAEPKPSRKGRAKGVDLKPRPADQIKDCREGSVQALFVDLLSQGWGTTFEELKAAQHRWALENNGQPWADVTVRSGLNWDMNHVKGYGVKGHIVNGAQAWREEMNWDAAASLGFPVNELGHPDEAKEEDVQAAMDRAIAEGRYDPNRTVQILHLVLPEGMDAPLPHRARKGKDKKEG